MTKDFEAVVRFAPVDGGAFDGRYKFVCAGTVGSPVKLARWMDDRFALPGGEPVGFSVTHYACAHKLIRPEGAGDD